MSNYNPYVSAFSAATAELTSPAAVAYYTRRAQSDSQAVLIATVQAGVALYEAAVMAYQFDLFIRALYESTKPQPEVAAIVLAQPAAITVFDVDYDFDLDYEILEESPVLLLSAAPEVAIASTTAHNQAWIASNITPLAPAKALPSAKATPKANAPRKTRSKKVKAIA